MSNTHIEPSRRSPFLGLALRELAENWWLLLLRGVAAIASKGGEIAPRWWLAVVGIAGIVAGALAFVWPGMTALVLLLFIASWAIVIGILQIWGAIRLRREIEGEWLLGLSGLLSVAFGVIMFAQPGAGALAVVWLIGWFAILAGCVYIALAFQLKKHKRPA